MKIWSISHVPSSSPSSILSIFMIFYFLISSLKNYALIKGLRKIHLPIRLIIDALRQFRKIFSQWAKAAIFILFKFALPNLFSHALSESSLFEFEVNPDLVLWGLMTKHRWELLSISDISWTWERWIALYTILGFENWNNFGQDGLWERLRSSSEQISIAKALSVQRSSRIFPS